MRDHAKVPAASAKPPVGSISESAHAPFGPLEHGVREQPDRPDRTIFM
jgi:hypothetical protein